MNLVSNAFRIIKLIKFAYLIPSGVFVGVLIAFPKYKTTWHITSIFNVPLKI